MYLFTYAVDDDNTNELYAEFHLGMVVLYTVYLIHANILYSILYIFQIGAQILNNFSIVSGRKSFRLCKKGTKFCAWVPGIPDFYEWMHLCEYLPRS